MITNIAMEAAVKGGPGSGFSDPNCRRGIPGQRGGSMNICTPGGYADALARGVDLTGVSPPVDAEIEGTSKLGSAKIESIQKAVRERIDEPNKVTQRDILQRQLNIPVSVFDRNQEYKEWFLAPSQASGVWNAAAYLEGVSMDDVRNISYTPPPSGRPRLSIPDFAEGLAVDREISRQSMKPQTLYRGVGFPRNVTELAERMQSLSPSDTLYLPNKFLESWTESNGFAHHFAEQSPTGGLVLSQRVEPDRVLFNHHVASPLKTEREHVLVNKRGFTPFRVGDLEIVNVR